MSSPTTAIAIRGSARPTPPLISPTSTPPRPGSRTAPAIARGSASPFWTKAEGQGKARCAACGSRRTRPPQRLRHRRIVGLAPRSADARRGEGRKGHRPQGARRSVCHLACRGGRLRRCDAAPRHWAPARADAAAPRNRSRGALYRRTGARVAQGWLDGRQRRRRIRRPHRRGNARMRTCPKPRKNWP